MDKFIVEEENEDENDNSTLVFSTVQRHPRANLVTFMLWFATLISFIDRYSLSGVLSEGKGQNYFRTVGSHIMEMCISEIYFKCDNISVQILHVFRYEFRTFYRKSVVTLNKSSSILTSAIQKSPSYKLFSLSRTLSLRL